jgi:hypothetical protein
MSEWIDVISRSLPPSCMSVLLYIVQLYNDEESLLNDEIITGFYDEEADKWAIEIIKDGRLQWQYFNETPTLRVLSWTLLPQRRDYEKYKQYHKEVGFPFFLKDLK